MASSGMRNYAEGQDVMAGHKGLSHLALSYSDAVRKRFWTADSACVATRDNTMCCKDVGRVHGKLHCVGLEPFTTFCLTCSELCIHADQH